MSGTSAITSTEEYSSLSASLQRLPNSTGTRCSRHSQFPKTYKLASNFFLTRRFAEALSTVKPLITVSQSADDVFEDGHDRRYAPIARADRKWRIRIWSFYLTLHNAIAELGSEEGKSLFGSNIWDSLVAKVNDGSIWKEVVEVGYMGDETRVDAEVVVNLANLLLSQSPTQHSNQAHLETYFSAAGSPEATNDGGRSHEPGMDGRATNGHQPLRKTENLRDLETHLQIIEIFALHVLPRNDEWDYARDFVNMSNVLDEERKDAFLQALKELQEENYGSIDQVEDEFFQQEGLPSATLPANQMGRTDSSVTVIPAPPYKQSSMTKGEGSDIGKQGSPSRSPDLRSISPRAVEEPSSRPLPKPLQQGPSRPTPTKPVKKPGQSVILKRTIAVWSAIHKLLSDMTLGLSQNPTTLLRFVLFLVALGGALSRKDIRERLQRLIAKGVVKVKHTLGMGVKVSYV